MIKAIMQENASLYFQRCAKHGHVVFDYSKVPPLKKLKDKVNTPIMDKEKDAKIGMDISGGCKLQVVNQDKMREREVSSLVMVHAQIDGAIIAQIWKEY